MAFERMNDDLNIIAKLGDIPGSEDGLSPQELKELFDKAPLLIQNFLNNSLIPEIEKHHVDLPVDDNTVSFINHQVKKAAPRGLLVNTYFRNPINQRGFSESYDNCFCIDRWKMVVSSGQGDISAVRLLGGYIQLNVGQGELDFEQTIENHDSFVGKRCTVAVNIEGTVYCNVFPFGQQTAPLYFGDTKLKFYSIAGRSAIFRITSDVDVRYNLLWADIFEGEYTAETISEYQTKKYGLELAECMRYYYRNWDGDMSPHKLTGLYCPRDARSISVAFPVPMRRIPEIILYNPATGHPGCVGDWATDADVRAEVVYVTKYNFTIAGDITAGQMISYNYEAIAEIL